MLTWQMYLKNVDHRENFYLQQSLTMRSAMEPTTATAKMATRIIVSYECSPEKCILVKLI